MLDLCRANDIPCRVEDLSLTDVYRADEMFCTGTMGELTPVTQVDGRPIGKTHPGPVTRKLVDLYAHMTRDEGVVVVEQQQPSPTRRPTPSPADKAPA